MGVLRTSISSDKYNACPFLGLKNKQVKMPIPNPAGKVFPIRQDILGSDAVRQVVDYAYDLWLSSAFRGCSPEGALLAALQMMREKTSAGLFLVTKTEDHASFGSEKVRTAGAPEGAL
jgi:hypothetical protein